MNRTSTDYILIDKTGAYWPGLRPYRGRTSRRGYRTAAEAHARAAAITTAYAAREGAAGGPDFRVIERGGDAEKKGE